MTNMVIIRDHRKSEAQGTTPSTGSVTQSELQQAYKLADPDRDYPYSLCIGWWGNMIQILSKMGFEIKRKPIARDETMGERLN